MTAVNRAAGTAVTFPASISVIATPRVLAKSSVVVISIPASLASHRCSSGEASLGARHGKGKAELATVTRLQEMR